jgi:hypothetical protein
VKSESLEQFLELTQGRGCIPTPATINDLLLLGDEWDTWSVQKKLMTFISDPSKQKELLLPTLVHNLAPICRPLRRKPSSGTISATFWMTTNFLIFPYQSSIEFSQK